MQCTTTTTATTTRGLQLVMMLVLIFMLLVFGVLAINVHMFILSRVKWVRLPPLY